MTAVGTSVDTARLLTFFGEEGRTTLPLHLEAYGPLPAPAQWAPGWAEHLMAEIERSGLTGRGGAGFPAHRKLRSARSAGPGTVLIVNAMEGEPASAKDRALWQRSPHLVLDGAELVAGVLRAEKVVVCVADDREPVAGLIAAALAERRPRGPPLAPVEVALLPGRFVAGEESALVRAVAGGTGIPAFRPDKSVPLRVGRRRALVHNVETLAHVALIARYGADWFREVGDPAAPGTCLVTVSGDVQRPGVLEVEVGTPLGHIIDRAGPSGPAQAVLVGGYAGGWVSSTDWATPFAPAQLKTLGATMGAGVLVVLGAGGCGIRETARLARFMAAESAGQCGPCLFGLPSIADDLEQLADGRADGVVWERLWRRVALVDGRGACRHPDGVARLVRSAMDVFAGDAAAHGQGFPCPASNAPSVLQLAAPVAPGKKDMYCI